MNKLIVVGVFGLALAGCVGTVVPPNADCDDVRQSTSVNYSYPNVRIDTLFGLNADVLAKTNLFPSVSNNWQHYKLSLGRNENGFTTCTVHMERDGRDGRLSLEYVELERSLKAGSDDVMLLDECRNALKWLNDKLGTEMELDALTELPAMLSRYGGDRGRMTVSLCHTSVYADVADGQEVCLAAHDAVFMKRGKDYVEMAPASIEITFRVGKDDCGRRLMLNRAVTQKDGKIVGVDDEAEPVTVQGVSIGTDISERLSKVMKAREKERPRMARPVGGKKGM